MKGSKSLATLTLKQAMATADRFLTHRQDPSMPQKQSQEATTKVKGRMLSPESEYNLSVHVFGK